MAWTPFDVAAPAGLSLALDTVTYGPNIGTEADLRLLGDVSGKRLLDLGCGAGRNAVALATAGARVIAIDESADQVAQARAAADAAEVRIEWHHGPLAELAFLRADTIDVALSVVSLAAVEDLGRVFRQLHRVLRTGQPLVLALPHPTFGLFAPGVDARTSETASAFDETPFPPGDPRHGRFNRSMSAVFVELARAGFSVDTVLEPLPRSVGGPHWSPVMERVPATLLLRARKEGI